MPVVLEYVRKKLGWCPHGRSRPGETPADTASAPADTQRRGAALPLRVIAPALILLLPLLPAALFAGYTLLIPALLPSTGVQLAAKALVVGTPAAVIILYGRMTSDAVGSTLAGALLVPLFGIYTQILGLLFVPAFLATPALYWLDFSLFAGMVPFIALLGAMGYFASRKTTGSLLAAAALGALAIAIVWGLR